MLDTYLKSDSKRSVMRILSAFASNSMLSIVGEYFPFMILFIVDFEIPDIIDNCLTEMFLLYMISLNNIFMMVIVSKIIFIILEFISSKRGSFMKNKILILSLCGMLAASSTAYASGMDPKQQKVYDDVIVKAVPTLSGKLCVFITNNSDTVIDELEVQANYKDASGSIIDTDRDGHDMILPGYTVVSDLDAPDQYEDVVVSKDIGLDENPSYENHSEDVKVSSNEGNDCIIVQIQNNSDVSIDEMEYIVVFYKGDDVSDMSYANDVYDVDPGKEITEKVSTHGIEYDKYEVYLNQAHTFGLD